MWARRRNRLDWAVNLLTSAVRSNHMGNFEKILMPKLHPRPFSPNLWGWDPGISNFEGSAGESSRCRKSGFMGLGGSSARDSDSSHRSTELKIPALRCWGDRITKEMTFISALGGQKTWGLKGKWQEFLKYAGWERKLPPRKLVTSTVSDFWPFRKAGELQMLLSEDNSACS